MLVLIPLGTDLSLRRTPLVTIGLIGLNVLIFSFTQLPGLLSPGGGLIGAQETAVGKSFLANTELSRAAFHWWTLISYALLHANFWHIGGNMLMLWVFGQCVEEKLGRIGFAALYLTGGAAAGLAHVAFSSGSVVGASGAVAAVTGAFLVLMPRIHIKCLLFFFIVGIYMIPAWWFIAFAIAKDFVLTGTKTAGNVATLAHIGGYIWGIAVAAALMTFKVLPREGYDLISIFKQSQRRREIRSAMEAAGHGGTRQPSPARGMFGGESTPPEAFDADGKAILPPADARTMQLRAELMDRIDHADWSRAKALMNELVMDRGPEHPLATLPREKQLLLSNGMLQAGYATEAARGYRQFLTLYRTDAEVPKIKVLLALVLSRYLSDPVGAKKVIEGVSELGLDEDSKSLLGLLRQA